MELFLSTKFLKALSAQFIHWHLILCQKTCDGSGCFLISSGTFKILVVVLWVAVQIIFPWLFAICVQHYMHVCNTSSLLYHKYFPIANDHFIYTMVFSFLSSFFQVAGLSLFFLATLLLGTSP